MFQACLLFMSLVLHVVGTQQDPSEYNQLREKGNKGMVHSDRSSRGCIVSEEGDGGWTLVSSHLWRPEQGVDDWSDPGPGDKKVKETTTVRPLECS